MMMLKYAKQAIHHHLLGTTTLLSAITIGAFLQAAESQWTGATGNFNDSANWSLGWVPGTSDSAVINNGGTAQLSSPVQVAQVGIGGASRLSVLPGITSLLDVSGEFLLGTSGTGTLLIGTEAAVATGDFFAGQALLSNGAITINGGALQTSGFYGGYAGDADITLENGATLNNTRAWVGYLAGSKGTIQLTDSTWRSGSAGTPADITVGSFGTGEIIATNSQISGLNLDIGEHTGSSGTISLSGGNLTIDQEIRIGISGTGSLSLSDSASATNNGTTIASLSGSTGSLSITDSSWTDTSDLTAGDQGEGTLTSENSQIEANSLSVARQTGSEGTATVTGGSLTLTQELNVADAGMGTLTVEGNANVSSDLANIGIKNGSVGEIHINDGTWTNTNAIFVGLSGDGTLNIGADGTVNSKSSSLASNASGVGAVHINGGTWEMSDTLVVGHNGTGSLTLTNSGSVSSNWAQIGLNAGSEGTVSLDNSSWTTNNTLTIASSGNGQLTATNGADIAANSIEVASSGGATGSLTVTNSTISTTSIIAGSGTASATFSGAEIKLLGGISVIDTLLIDGFAHGALEIATGGLTVNTQGGNAQIASPMSGAESLTKTGEGRLRLTTANGFSGGTHVNGGILEITSAPALGTGEVTLGSAELRSTADIVLSASVTGSPTSLVISSGSTGTLSTTTGNTFTINTTGFTLSNGAGIVFGSTGNNGTVDFSPSTLTLSGNVSQVAVNSGQVKTANSTLESLTAAAASTTVASGAILDFNDYLSGSGIRSLHGSGTVIIGASPSTSLVVKSGDFAGDISGGGSLVKESSGTLILSGQNTFTGGTTVNEGTLIVNGDLAFGLGEVTINPGGTLGGSGNVGTIFLNGGNLAPGNSPGTLTAQDLHWQSGGLTFDLGATQAGSDSLLIDHLDGLGSSYPISFMNSGWNVGTTYTLISYSSTNIQIDDFYFTNSGGFDGYFSYGGNNLNFTLTAIPEPSTSLLATLVTMVCLTCRIRKPNRDHGAP